MRTILAFALLAATPLARGADVAHVTVSLLSEQEALIPGSTAWLGIRLKHAPHWHTYWINPGDSGLPTRLSWQLPEGYRAGDIAWPAPTRITLGELYNFGYEDDTLLPVSLTVPDTAAPGAKVHIGLEAKWLECREECIPDKADLAIELPVRAEPPRTAPRTRRLFDATRAALPQPAAWTGTARLRDDRVEITLHDAALPPSFDAFVVQRKVVNYAPPQISRAGNDVTLSFAKSDYFSAEPSRIDVVLRADRQAWGISLPFVPSPPP